MEHDGDGEINCNWCFWKGFQGLGKRWKELDIGGRHLRLAKIFRRFLKTRGDLQSLRHQ